MHASQRYTDRVRNTSKETNALIDSHVAAGRKVAVLSGSTGVCAVRLSGYATTAHHAFCIPLSEGGRPEPLSPRNPKFVALLEADVFIVDEYSMLTASVLDFILYRLQQVHWSSRKDGEPYTDVLEGKMVVLVGESRDRY